MSGELTRLHFHCRACGSRFEAEPGRIVDVEDRAWQPHEYFAECRDCGREAAQAAWEVNLAKGHAMATGPRTPEGIAAATARLKGHPTPEEAKRTRFNALKHGAFAKTANYWPARPGAYEHCETCEHFENGCNTRPAPGHRNPPGCLKRVELMMQFQMAFDTGDPQMLREHHATLQALAWQMVSDMYRTVIKDGVSLRTPEWKIDETGTLHIARYVDTETGELKTIYKVEAHPLLKVIIEYMNRNGMALPDSGMTMKVRDENETIKGFLDQQGETTESALEYQARQTKALEGLAALVDRSQRRQARDPVLIEHQALEKSDGE